MLTRADLLTALAKHGQTTPVRDAMQRQLCTAEADELIEPVLARLQADDCRALPVTSRGQLVGLLTIENLGEYLMIQTALNQATRDRRSNNSLVASRHASAPSWAAGLGGLGPGVDMRSPRIDSADRSFASPEGCCNSSKGPLSSLDDPSRPTEANLTESEAHLDSLDRDLTSLEARLDSLNSRSRWLDGDFDSLDAQALRLDASGESLDRDRALLDARERSLEEDGTALEPDRASLEGGGLCLGERGTKLEARVAPLEMPE